MSHHWNILSPRHGDETMPTEGGADENTFPPHKDVFLWLHAFIMSSSIVILMVGMVLGLSKRERGLHIALQAIGLGLIPLGLILPSFHKSYHLPEKIPHRFLGWIIVLTLIGQAVVGFLRTRAPSSTVKSIHRIIGYVFFLLFPAQIELGFIAITETCYSRGYHTGQCVAHFIMGSAFIYYGSWTAMRYFGLLRCFSKPDSFYDSIVILSWGIVNSFTEHNWGHEWNMGDIQHTSMGVLWACSGALSLLFYTKTFESVRDYNFIPSIVFAVTGLAMSLHFQHRPISTIMHAFFGIALMLGSLTKLIGMFAKTGKLDLFVGFWMVLAGVLFMGSNEEALAYLEDKIMMDASSYMMLLVSATFLIYGFILFLLNIYLSKSEASNVQDLGTPLTTIPSDSGYVGIATEEDEHMVSK